MQKSLFYIHYVFVPTRVNSTPFILAHMQADRIAKKGPISFGGMITYIARALGLESELATLMHYVIPSLDIDAFCHMWLIKNRRHERYSLMIGNREVPSIILPFLNRTDVQKKANLIYNLNVGTYTGPVPMDIPENVNAGGATDDEYDHKE